MSSRARDNPPPTKEKRGKSPHTSLPPQHHIRSPTSSTTISPARSLDSTPNYLKTKETSRLEASNAKKQGKKQAVDGAHNSTLTSRRSFEKPPPRSQSRVSPNPAYRSSSFTGKPVSRPGKQYGRPVSNVKKIYVKKQDIRPTTLTTNEQVISPTEKVEDPETRPAIQEMTVSEGEEERVQVEDDDEKGDDELVVKDQEPVKIEQNEANSDKDDAENVEEISKEKDELIDNNNDTDQSVVDNTNEEVQDKEAEVEDEEDKKEETSSENEAPAENKEEKIEARSVQAVAHGKRDLALSNDVIEETATKLRQQRKNKVRALAGAFETVISLQDK